MSEHWVRVARRSRSELATPGPLGVAYDEGRNLADKGFYSACYAPSLSLYFDQRGRVRPCGFNQVALGRIPDNTIREIWDGEPARRLRDALVVGDLSRGCAHCSWQLDGGNAASVYARKFDGYPAPVKAPAWPVQMEFSISNTCNLQCAMCSGEFSSAIRTHREHRAPMPMPYGDAFFDELGEFVPHLRKVNVLGGEPFVSLESLRLLELLAASGSDVVVNVTTNGTRWTPRVERIFEQIPLTLVLSLDGITKETYESIRVGARFETVMTNLDRFQAYAERNQTFFGLAFCLMTTNWFEFADLLRFAEDRHLPVTVNTVRFPLPFSLYHQPAAALAEVLAELERQDRSSAAELTTLRPVWEEQLDMLRRRLASRTAERAPTANIEAAQPVAPRAPGLLQEWGAEQAWRIDFDVANVATAVHPDTGDVAGLPNGELLGARFEGFLERFTPALGPIVHRSDALTDYGLDGAGADHGWRIVRRRGRILDDDFSFGRGHQ